MNNLMDTGDVKTYLLDLQSPIVSRLEALNGKSFGTDTWARNEGGGGLSRLESLSAHGNGFQGRGCERSRQGSSFNLRENTIIEFLRSLDQPQRIEHAAIDMWQPYKEAIQTVLPM